MDCCPCSETADERYARWDREASEARAAALASPDTWIPQGGVEDPGDIGGDVQAGAAHSRRFIRWMPSVSKWAVINDAYYQIEDERSSRVDGPLYAHCNGPTVTGIDRQVELIICTDPADPGGTEEWADYVYEGVCTEPRRSDYDAYAKELATDSKAEDYPDPSNVVPSWTLTS